MNFTRLLELIGDEPVFNSAVLLAGLVNPADLYRSSPAGRKPAAEPLFCVSCCAARSLGRSLLREYLP